MKTKILLLITVFLFGVSAISQSHNLVLVFTAVDSATYVQTASEKSWQVSAKALTEVDLLSSIFYLLSSIFYPLRLPQSSFSNHC
jgi:hypothetical protein